MPDDVLTADARGTGSQRRAATQPAPDRATFRRGVVDELEESRIWEALAIFKAQMLPWHFHQLLGKYERDLHPILSRPGFWLSPATPEATSTAFDRSYRMWQQRMARTTERSGARHATPELRDPVQEMWRAASGDPIAAAYIVLGYLISRTVGRVLGFEQDPELATKVGRFASHGAQILAGGHGLRQALRGQQGSPATAGRKAGTRPPRSAPKRDASQQKRVAATPDPASAEPRDAQSAPSGSWTSVKKWTVKTQKARDKELARIRTDTQGHDYRVYKTRYDAAKNAIDFERFLHFDRSEIKAQVNIGVLRRTRTADFDAADRLAGYGQGKRPKNHVWHHHQDLGILQLVHKSRHAVKAGNNLDHVGGRHIHESLPDKVLPRQ